MIRFLSIGTKYKWRHQKRCHGGVGSRDVGAFDKGPHRRLANFPAVMTQTTTNPKYMNSRDGPRGLS